MNSREKPGDQLLVVFDGQCGMCSRLVRWLLKRDELERLRFVPSDSPIAGAILRRHGLSVVTVGKTILAVRNFGEPQEGVLLRSTAVVAIFGVLPSPWPLVAKVLKWLPRGLRDLAYMLVARIRYRIWGRLASCPLPTAAERGRFL